MPAALCEGEIRGGVQRRERPDNTRAIDSLFAADQLAWWRQWPRTFTRTFGEHAPSIVEWADAAVVDQGSYIKLARIATAHLAGVL